MKRVKAIASLDMVMNLTGTELQKKYIKNVIIHFQASKKPLGTPIALKNGLAAVSAGHSVHDYTPGAAIEKVFEYFGTM